MPCVLGANQQTYEYDVKQIGQTIHYLGRWISRKGNRGPLSTTVSALVNG
jgi:hypothetical protein